MIFKTTDGKESVLWEEVTFVEVHILATLGPDAKSELQKVITGEKARKLMVQLKLAWPQEDDAQISTRTTGNIAIHYRLANETVEKARVLSIENSRLLQDQLS